MKQLSSLVRLLCVFAFFSFTCGRPAFADETSTTGGKTFIDYFQPTPILSPLSKDAWGVAFVGPRDQKNGLEDSTLTLWDYWDGRIIKSADGKYHFFAAAGISLRAIMNGTTLRPFMP